MSQFLKQKKKKKKTGTGRSKNDSFFLTLPSFKRVASQAYLERLLKIVMFLKKRTEVNYNLWSCYP